MQTRACPRSSRSASPTFAGASRLALELGRYELELALASATHDLRANGAADHLTDDDALEVVHPFDWRALELDDQIFGTHPGQVGWTALDHLCDLDTAPAAELTRESRRQRPRAACDAEVGTPESSFGHQRSDDAPGGGIDRHGKA